jgi:hypothetical protein
MRPDDPAGRQSDGGMPAWGPVRLVASPSAGDGIPGATRHQTPEPPKRRGPEQPKPLSPEAVLRAERA